MIEGATPSGERRAAQHCEELLANPLETVDLAGEFARFGTRFARALQPRLAKLFDARKLETELVERESVVSPALIVIGEVTARDAETLARQAREAAR